ncbi:hypothetical protein BH11VER1_BH11VER1_18730 [soil metagenome]
MKTFIVAWIGVLCAASVIAAEPREVPASPTLKELADTAQAAAIVLSCIPNAGRSGLSVTEVLKGQEAYAKNKQQLAPLIPSGDPKAITTDGYRELIFIGPSNAQGVYIQAHSVALWPARSEKLGTQIIRFLAHDYAEVRRAICGKVKKEEAESGRNGD